MTTPRDLDPADFFDRLYPQVFRFLASQTGAPSSDVDDLVQETLVHAWRERARFRGESSLETWVLAIARNRARMRRRSESRREAVERALTELDRAPVPRDLLSDEELVARVRRALDGLDPAYSAVLVARYFDGRSVRSIAEEAGESEKAVESRLARARDALREALGKDVE